MATISRTGISDGGTIQPAHITNIIDALDGTSATTTVVATGSFTGSLIGELTGTASFATNILNTQVTNTTTGTGPYSITFVDVSAFNPAFAFSTQRTQLVDASGLTYNASTNTITTTASYAATASFALNAAGGGGGIFALTGSTYATTNNLEITGSLQVTAGVTASVQGTASYSNVSRNSEVVRASTNAAFFPVLVDSANATATAAALKSTTYLTINPSTDTISGATVSGSLNVSSSLTAQSNATVNFNSIGAQGNFSIPITALSAPTTGSMYWDDSTGILYIYSVTNTAWYNIQLNQE